MRTTARSSMLAAVAAIALAATLAACAPSTPAGPGTKPVAAVSNDTTAAAQATLGRFFAAWSSKDASAANAFLPETDRDGLWEFEKIDRVVFGPITPYPEAIASYMNTGSGSASGVRRDDVRAFRATITFYLKKGAELPAEDGRAMDYMWFLERQSDGQWQVTDWGY